LHSTDGSQALTQKREKMKKKKEKIPMTSPPRFKGRTKKKVKGGAPHFILHPKHQNEKRGGGGKRGRHAAYPDNFRSKYVEQTRGRGNKKRL